MSSFFNIVSDRFNINRFNVIVSRECKGVTFIAARDELRRNTPFYHNSHEALNHHY